jgi:hypothetical protein
MAVPRKTLAETKAEHFALGFYRCLRIITREWRARARPTEGPTVMADLWPIIEKMEAHGGLYDEDFKELNLQRYGYEFERLRRRVEVLKPHPHAGRKGFILDSETFLHEGMHRVYFLDEGKVDNAFCRPDWLRRLK